MIARLFFLILIFFQGNPFLFGQKLPITIADADSIHDVGDPQISPDGKWVTYTVLSSVVEEDYFSSDLWMTSWDGITTLQLTHTKEEDETMPRWSSDNKYLAFLSSRSDSNEVDQLWLMNRMGGEAEKLTEFDGGVIEYTWSPDAKKIALIVDVIDTNKYMPGTETPVPIVIDRYYFKEDYSGYLTNSRHHLYVMDVATKKSEQIVKSDFNEDQPCWSPDSKSIAFVSKRAKEDYDRDNNYDLYIVEAKAGSEPRQLTTNEGADNDPSFESQLAWSPDGKYIAYLYGGPQKLIYYSTNHLAIVPVAGGDPKILTQPFDRNVIEPHWSPDGKEIYFLWEDNQNMEMKKISVNGGEMQQVVPGRYTIYKFDIQPDNKMAVLYSTPDQPLEVFLWEGNQLRQLSHLNDKWLARHQPGITKEFESKSKDGTMISGFTVFPHDYVEGKKYPTILHIHGGPTSQNQNEWFFDWQLYASWGYVLVSMNPRGSTTKGEKFATAIFADWGNKDAQDVLSGVDELVKRGIADPNRLGVEGWSYGGILTNYVIAQDHRFKCAVSGAGISNIFAGYGTDMYIREYEAEIGTPWTNFKTYEKLSFPFLHADRIKTPTLFMCGQLDFNVPLLNSEQMYQALRSLGIETQLIIYPDQYHGIDVPSYLRDRFERRKQWFDKYLLITPSSETHGSK